MSDNKVENKSSGVPMAELIGEPLRAACEAQAMLEKATAEFLEKISIEDEGKNDKIEARKKSKQIDNHGRM